MYGDPEVMRRRANALRDQATDLRAAADRLVAQADAVAWAGRAADALRERIRERASHLREVAATHDDAADSLDAHLAEVDRLQDAIAQVERKVDTLVSDARHRIALLGDLDLGRVGGGGVGASPTRDDEALAGFVPPPAGHRDWLAVTVPGL